MLSKSLILSGPCFLHLHSEAGLLPGLAVMMPVPPLGEPGPYSSFLSWVHLPAVTTDPGGGSHHGSHGWVPATHLDGLN